MFDCRPSIIDVRPPTPGHWLFEYLLFDYWMFGQVFGQVSGY
jgi:hypothetical protein